MKTIKKKNKGKNTPRRVIEWIENLFIRIIFILGSHFALFFFFIRDKILLNCLEIEFSSLFVISFSVVVLLLYAAAGFFRLKINIKWCFKGDKRSYQK